MGAGGPQWGVLGGGAPLAFPLANFCPSTEGGQGPLGFSVATCFPRRVAPAAGDSSTRLETHWAVSDGVHAAPTLATSVQEKSISPEITHAFAGGLQPLSFCFHKNALPPRIQKHADYGT